MSWVNLSYGVVVTGFNTSLTPSISGSPPVGSIGILSTGIFLGNQAPPAVSGWNLKTTTGTAQQRCQAIYTRTLTGSGDAPTVTWPASQDEYAFISVYSGGSETLDGTPTANYDNSSPSGILYGALTISNPNCLVIALGLKNTAQASAAFSAFGSFTVRVSGLFSPGPFSMAYNEWIQTTATSISSGGQVVTPSDSGAEPNSSQVIALLPASVVVPQTYNLESNEYF